MAPSSLIYYLGVDKRLKNLSHHNLFFDQEFESHANDIYAHPAWPKNPLFYASLTTQTDPSGAPEGSENLFLLIPVAAGLKDDNAIREQYYSLVMDRLEQLTGQEIRSHVVFKRSYAYSDFISDYSAFKGNAYGLANTLRQTAILKPACRSKKIKNLFYTGQLTVPGPGVPPALISGQVVADEISKLF
jgi:phytoene desaturase